MTTNREWLNNLASTDMPGLDAWMDAEHTDGNPLTDNLMRSVAENLGSEPGNGSKVGSEVDSRTQLIADIQAWLESNVGFSVWLTDLMEQVHGWLDRQAAITECECIDKRIADQIGNMWESRKIAELQAKLDYLEGHGVEIVDAVAGGYEVYNEWYRKAQELEEAMAMDSRIRAQQSDAVDNLAKQRDVWKTKCETREVAYKQANAERKRYSEQIDELRAERDALAADLEECMEERERYRACFGSAVDKAHEIQRIMDRFCTSGKGAGACQSPANGQRTRNRVAEGGKPDRGGSSGVYAMPRQQITTDYMQTV